MRQCNANAGHTISGGDIGTRGVGGLAEEVLTRQTVNEFAIAVRENGWQCNKVVVDWAADLDDSLNKQCALCDSYGGAEYNVVIHYNSSKGNVGFGCEIYTLNGERIPQAVKILENLNRLGFANRGVKPGDLALINRTKAITIYVEVCFIDNPIDAALLNKHGVKNIARAIANGFLLKDYSASGSNNVINTSYKGKPGTVTADVLNIRDKASTNSAIIGTLRNGDNVDIYKKVGEWYSIYYGDHGGYVHSDYIKTNENQKQEAVKKVRNAVVYSNDVDKRAASYLVDYFNAKGEDGKLVHVSEYKDGMATSVYVVGGGCDKVKANVNLIGANREDTLKLVCKRMGWKIQN